MIHKKSDILFTLIVLMVIVSTGIFLRHKVVSGVNRPPILIDGTYDPAMASKRPAKELDDYIDASDDVPATKADPLLLEAMRLREDGYLDAALSILERVHSQDPANEEAMNTLVSAYIASKQLLKAEQMLSQLLELNPKNERFYYNLGVVKSMQGDSAEAVKAYTRALALNPDHTRTYYNLGMIHLKMGALDKAEACFVKVTLKDKSAGSAKSHFQLGYVLSRQKGRIDEAIAAYRKAIVLRPDYYQARNNLAIQLEKADEKEAAIAELKKAIMLKPSAASALLNLGRLYSESDKFDEAAHYYRLAAEANPSLTKAFFHLGTVEEERGRSQEAIEAYESVLAAESDHLGAIIRLGMLYRQADKPEKAAKYFKRALSIDPKYASAWNGLGALYANQNRYKEALKHYNQAIQLDPGNVSTHFNKAIVLESMKRNKEAARVYNEILKKDTAHIKSRCKLVQLYARTGDFKRAKAQVGKLNKLAPNDPEVLAAVSFAYLAMDLPDEAVIRQKKLVELMPDDMPAMVTLGEIYDRLGRYAEAIEAYLAVDKQIQIDAALLRAIGKAYENNSDPDQARVYFERAAELEAVKPESPPEKQ